MNTSYFICFPYNVGLQGKRVLTTVYHLKGLLLGPEDVLHIIMSVVVLPRLRDLDNNAGVTAFFLWVMTTRAN